MNIKKHKYTVYRVIKNNQYFIQENDAKKRVRSILNRRLLREEEYDDNIEKIEDNYENYKDAVKLSKEEKYNFKDIKVFTNNWTMEFDIALSCIREYLYAAVLIAEDIYGNEKEIEEIRIKDFIQKSKSEIEFDSLFYDDMQIAYKIYKPLLNKKASKAVCAQYLAKILIEEVDIDDKLIDKILKDDYLKYIIDAINNVTPIESEAVIND